MSIRPIQLNFFKVLPKAFILGGVALVGRCQYGTSFHTIGKNVDSTAYVQRNFALDEDLVQKPDGCIVFVDSINKFEQLEASLRIDSVAKTNYALGIQVVGSTLVNKSEK